ncbi:MAG: hypothetical protein CVV51_02585 [Spirochaetae bacterium HGW-Spirochaetae-7]|nr:MAG: hypothetical protein CVV51_02585 [Spirochaetae bacterium HGW-Spirochaetae-7]
MLIPFVNRFIHWAIVGVMSPILVLMIMSKGVPVEGAGIVLAAMSAAVILFELPSGVLSDLVGRRRVYLVSIAIAASGYALMLSADGFAGVVVAAALYGVSRAFSSGSIEALYIDAYIERRGKDRLHSLMTAMGVAETLGLAIGALGGGAIPVLWKRLHPQANPYNGNLVVQIALLAALFCMTLFTSRRDGPRREDRHSGEHSTGTRLTVLLREAVSTMHGNGTIVRLLAGAAFWGLSFSAIELYWQPRLRGILGGADATWIFGFVNAACFAAAVAGNVIIGAALRKARPRSGMAIIGVLRIIAGCSILALAMQGAVPGFVALFLAVMCCNGMMSVPEATVFNTEVPPSARASFLSIASLSVQLGGIVSSLAFSTALRFISIDAVWVIAGALLFGSAFLYLGKGRRASVPAASPGSASVGVAD